METSSTLIDPLGVWSLGARQAHWGLRQLLERLQVEAARLRWQAEVTGAWDAEKARPTLKATLIAGAATFALPFAGLLALEVGPYLAPASLTEQYIVADRNAQAIELSDAQGRWLGVIPAAMRVLPGKPQRSPYLVMDAAAPDEWFAVLKALEDRNLDSWRSVNGIDVFSIVRSIPSLISRRGGPGGSGLSMMLVRCMHSMDPQAGSRLTKIGRKLMELGDAPALFRRVHGDSLEFRRLVSRHMPLVVGSAGSRMGQPLHGLGMSSEVLWGKRPEELSLAQLAVLAAAVRRPIIVAPEGDQEGTAQAETRWKLVVDRAILGVRLAFPTDPRGAAAIAELQSMPRPRPELRAGLSGPASVAFQVATNPEARAANLARPELIAAQGEMLNRLGPDARNVVAVRLSVDEGENARFAGVIEQQLQQAEVHARGALFVRLTSHGIEPANADVIMAVVKDDRIVRYYSNSQEPLFNGSLAERDGDLVYQPTRGLRPVGSVAKAAIAVMLGETDRPDTKYCNESLGGAVHNASGDPGLPCSNPAAWVGVPLVFGESLNLPLAWRLKSFSDDQLREQAKRYGLALQDGVRPRIAFPLGLATARPVDLLTMMEALGRGASGERALVREPHIVASYRLAGQTAWRATAERDATLDVSRDFEQPSVARYVSVALSSPLKPGGTLAGIAGAVPAAEGHLAKSGTTSAGDPTKVRDKLAAGSFRLNGHHYGYVFLLGARDPKAGIGSRVPWSAFHPLIAYAIRSAAQP